MKKEYSAGGIVFNDNKQVLLIKNHKGIWQFPKGHLEESETNEQAAIREVKEESGIDGEILELIGLSEYVYTFESGKKISKVVTLFLMRYISGQPLPQEAEVAEVIWTNSDNVIDLLTFENDKELYSKALELMNL